MTIRPLFKSFFIVAAVFVGGCASDDAPPSPRDSEGLAPARPATAPRGLDAKSDNPVLVINGESVGWDDLVGPLGEAGGGPVVEELVLTSALRREFLRRGWTLTQGDIDAEQALFNQNLEVMAGPGAQGSPVEAVRRARGIGPARYAALLERNAMLRQVVRDDVVVTAEEVDVAMAVRHGSKVRVRLIVAPTEREASEIHGRLVEAKRAGADLRSKFAEEATRWSIDPTGPGGGVNEPISPTDPSLPLALRRAIDLTPVNELSAVIALDRTFAIVLPEERIEALADPSAMRPAVEREARLRKERIAMEEVAKRMVETANVTVFDPSLRYGWENRRRR